MKRSSLKIMFHLVKLIKPLLAYMLIAVFFGVCGFILVAGIGAVGGYFILQFFRPEELKMIPFGVLSRSVLIGLLILAVILRGFFRYAEQLCNHYVAFKILATLRNQIFQKICDLAPAKLEKEEQGDLFNIINGDVERLEIFFAHTISPILIALLTCLIQVLFFLHFHWSIALLALIAYVYIGLFIPVFAARKLKTMNYALRKDMAKVNGFFLECLYGMQELLQFNIGHKMQKDLHAKVTEARGKQEKIRQNMATIFAQVDSAILIFSFLMLLLSLFLFQTGIINLAAAFIINLVLLGSYGSVIALANLGGGLLPTLVAGDRMLSLFAEIPETVEIKDGQDVSFGPVTIENINFSYADTAVLKDLSATILPGDIIGIQGDSGSGKSTLLKLLLRFWAVDSGEIKLNGKNINEINTASLHEQMSYMTQATALFVGTIRDNIKIARMDASDEEILKACEQASLDEFIASLDAGLDTWITDLGGSFSGGEKQRIGLARCFLSSASLMLLDEPTSNLDSLNEGAIIAALQKQAENKTILIVSHRDSTLGFTKKKLYLKAGCFINK